MVTGSEAAILRTLLFLGERLKIVVEPTGTLAAAALLEGAIARSAVLEAIAAPGARVGVIISGGNMSLQQISLLMEMGTTKSAFITSF